MYTVCTIPYTRYIKHLANKLYIASHPTPNQILICTIYMYQCWNCQARGSSHQPWHRDAWVLRIQPKSRLLDQSSNHSSQSYTHPATYSPLKYLLVHVQHSTHSWVEFFIFLHTSCMFYCNPVLVTNLEYRILGHDRRGEPTLGAIVTVLKLPSPGIEPPTLASWCLSATRLAKESTHWPE